MLWLKEVSNVKTSALLHLSDQLLPSPVGLRALAGGHALLSCLMHKTRICLSLKKQDGATNPNASHVQFAHGHDTLSLFSLQGDAVVVASAAVAVIRISRSCNNANNS